MKRVQALRKRGFAFAVLAAISVVVSSGLLFGLPSLLALLKQDNIFTSYCDAESSPKQSLSLCLGTGVSMSIVATVCAVAFHLGAPLADFLVSVCCLSGRLVYALGAALISLGAIIYCIFVYIDYVVFICIGLISLGGAVSSSALMLVATKQRTTASKLTETHITAAQLVGAGIVSLMMFFHELFQLSSLILFGSLGVLSVFFAVLSIIFWPRGVSRSFDSLPNLQSGSIIYNSSGSSEEDNDDDTTQTEDEYTATSSGSSASSSGSGSANGHQKRTSLDQIVTRFAPSYGSVSENMNTLMDASQHYRSPPRYGDFSFKQQLLTFEFIIFAIYFTIVNYWIIFFLSSVHYRLSEAGAISTESEYTPLLVWMIAASAVLVPLMKLLTRRIGLVGAMFLLHVSFSLWSLCLILRQYQLILVSFVLLGATRGLLSGMETVYIRRLFGQAYSRHLASILGITTALGCTLLYPALQNSVSTFHLETAQGFVLPTIIQDASAAVLLCVPIALWMRNVDSLKS